MRRDVETYTELCDALAEPKATLASACRAIGLSVASAGRWLRASKAAPTDNEFLWRGETAPLHTQVRRAARIAHERWLKGERPSRPLKARPRPAPDPDYDDTDVTADAVAAPEPSVTVTDIAPTESAEPMSALKRDLLQRIEARKSGTPLPPIVPVQGAAPYVSPEARAEGIGRGEPKPGGMKVA